MNTTFYHNPDNVREYIDMSKGYDGALLIKELKENLPEGKSLLELGMGEGKDLEELAKSYEVVGSDNSDIFLNLYKEKNPTIEVINLDVKNISIDRKFDGIYSNKVLHHILEEELEQSIIDQSEILNENGIILHSFWQGTMMEEYDDMFAMHYMKNDLIRLFEKQFEIIKIRSYAEMSHDDSLFIVAQKR